MSSGPPTTLNLRFRRAPPGRGGSPERGCPAPSLPGNAVPRGRGPPGNRGTAGLRRSGCSEGTDTICAEIHGNAAWPGNTARSSTRINSCSGHDTTAPAHVFDDDYQGPPIYICKACYDRWRATWKRGFVNGEECRLWATTAPRFRRRKFRRSGYMAPLQHDAMGPPHRVQQSPRAAAASFTSTMKFGGTGRGDTSSATPSANRTCGLPSGSSRICPSSSSVVPAGWRSSRRRGTTSASDGERGEDVRDAFSPSHQDPRDLSALAPSLGRTVLASGGVAVATLSIDVVGWLTFACGATGLRSGRINRPPFRFYPLPPKSLATAPSSTATAEA